MAQPLGREGGCPVGFGDLGDAELVGLRRRGGERQRDLAQPQLQALDLDLKVLNDALKRDLNRD